MYLNHNPIAVENKANIRFMYVQSVSAQKREKLAEKKANSSKRQRNKKRKRIRPSSLNTVAKTHIVHDEKQ